MATKREESRFKFRLPLNLLAHELNYQRFHYMAMPFRTKISHIIHIGMCLLCWEIFHVNADLWILISCHRTCR